MKAAILWNYEIPPVKHLASDYKLQYQCPECDRVRPCRSVEEHFPSRMVECQKCGCEFLELYTPGEWLAAGYPIEEYQ